VGGAVTQTLYDGDRLVAEYDKATGQLLRRYVHGAGVDEPLVWYEGSGLTTRNYLHTDELGSVVATSDNSGNVTSATIYPYDAFGRPGNDTWVGSRFRYTGQIAMPEVRLYYYKARVYDPVLGRFLQTDAIGYAAGDMNLYSGTRGRSH
jgi:RHS repeat-associated protein